MELGVSDRLVLLSLLPKEGDLTTIRIVHELQQALSFSEEEHGALGFRTENDQVFWKENVVVDIPIAPRAHVLIEEALRKLDAAKKLTEEYLGVWDKFVHAPIDLHDNGVTESTIPTEIAAEP